MSNSCADYFNIFHSLLGIGCGISAFVVFLHFRNIDAGSWAMASAVFAAVVFHMHYLNYRQTLDSWHDYDTLRGIQCLGVMGVLIGVAATAWYIFCGVYYSIPILPIRYSAHLSALCTLFTAKWGFMTVVFAKSYTCDVRRENPRLLTNS